jgi:putative glycerol-1-phosphate prenyltransferase
VFKKQMNCYKNILKAVEEKRKLFAVLIDPEKCDLHKLEQYVDAINTYHPDFVFIGGSQMQCSVNDAVAFLKNRVAIPVILFPGNALQFSENADAILLLSLISGRNAEFLIGQHVKAAKMLKKSSVEILPTGYILIEGGRESATARISKTLPLSIEKSDEIVSTALAGEQLGLRLIYLEAGSGAKCPVSQTIIAATRAEINVPLIVGGGIKTRQEMLSAYEAGADIVVVGNVLEDNPYYIAEFLYF